MWPHYFPGKKSVIPGNKKLCKQITQLYANITCKSILYIIKQTAKKEQLNNKITCMYSMCDESITHSSRKIYPVFYSHTTTNLLFQLRYLQQYKISKQTFIFPICKYESRTFLLPLCCLMRMWSNVFSHGMDVSSNTRINFIAFSIFCVFCWRFWCIYVDIHRHNRRTCTRRGVSSDPGKSKLLVFIGGSLWTENKLCPSI